MKKNLLFLVINLIFLSSNIIAQEKLLSINDATIGLYRNLAPKNLHGIQWRGSTEFYTYYQGNSLLQNSAIIKNEVSIADLEDINSKLASANIDKLNSFPYYSYKWINDNIITFQSGKHYILYNITNSSIEKTFSLNKNAANIKLSPNHKIIAFTTENNLFLSFGEEILAVTEDKNKDIINGDGYVHRQEFGITEGIFWSPKGNYIAFYRKDETMVTDYPLLKINETPATAELIKYPMAGMKSEEVTLGVYNINAKTTVFMKTGEPKEQYLTAISWSPEEKSMYIGILNRGQNHLKLNRYNAQTGDFDKTLFEEKSSKYVEPENPMFFLPNNNNKFLWFSERDGYNHLYLYNISGKLEAQITKGNWIVTDFLGFDKSNKNVFIKSTKYSPLESHLYSVDIAKKKLVQLTKIGGTHSITANLSKGYFIDNYSNINTPRTINVINAKSKVLKNILVAENTLSKYDMPEMTMSTIKSADGKTELHYRLIKPINFDAEKKYPAIIYVYGGPHVQLVKNKWLGGARLWEYFMAQNGYVMLTVDNRGSANRGFEFESIIHRQVGQNEMADQMEGIKLLENLGFVDMDKIGVHGWSFGGFMTTSLMLNHADVFKIGVAGGPVMDWKFYEIMYGERYMDTPQENPEGYELTSCINKTDQLKGKLFLIHGLVDPVVVPQNSLVFQNECVKTMKFPQLYFYGNHEHNVRGMDRVHLMQMISEYFFENLK